jgi:C_GCAxxG_C_C family probable redox protein
MEPAPTLSSIIIGGLNRREDLNCAETVLTAASRAYGLDLPPSALKLAAGFGGGMAVESTCGALAGGVMALSALFVRERSHESERIKTLTREYLNRFAELHGSIDCSYLKDRLRESPDDCTPVMIEAGKLLQEIIDRELAAETASPHDTPASPASGRQPAETADKGGSL